MNANKTYDFFKCNELPGIHQQSKCSSTSLPSRTYPREENFSNREMEEKKTSEVKGPPQTPPRADNELAYSCSIEAMDDKYYKRFCSFPNTLMEILSKDDYSKCIRWCPNGRAFEISSPETFASEVLAPHFKNCKYDSFVRKLYRWGFRMTGARSKNSFYHEKFLKDKKELISHMSLRYSPKELRLKRTKKSIRKSSVLQMLRSEESSCVQGLQSSKPQTQELNVNPLVHPIGNFAIPLQLPEQNFLYVPNISLLPYSQIIPLTPTTPQLYSFSPNTASVFKTNMHTGLSSLDRSGKKN